MLREHVFRVEPRVQHVAHNWLIRLRQRRKFKPLTMEGDSAQADDESAFTVLRYPVPSVDDVVGDLIAEAIQLSKDYPERVAVVVAAQVLDVLEEHDRRLGRLGEPDDLEE